MLSGQLAADMSPEPILSAVDGYRGSIVDLDNARIVGPEAFAAGWQNLSRRLGECGLAVGDRVVVAIGNGPLFIAAWVAILTRGGSPLPVHFETPPAELKRTALRFGARFVATDAQQEADIEPVASRVKTLSHDSWVRLVWAEVDPEGPSGAQAILHLPGVPLHPTSGTTGRAKVAIRPASCAVAETRHYVETIGIDRSDTLLAVAPMSHAYGHGMCVVTPMVTGASVVSMRRFNAKTMIRACQEHDVTVLPSVAAMLDTLLFGAGNRLYNPKRRIITGGGPLSKRTATNFEKISGARVRPLYGTTEAGAITVARADGKAAIGGCVGPPFDGVSVEIRPAEDPAQFDEKLGLVHVRSPSVMVGYLYDEKIDTAVLEDGWFNTGDLGWIDEDGALHLSGRQADVINVSGMKVLPGEVEEVIAALPAVEEVKVYPGKNRSGSHHVKAAVVVGDSTDVAAIKAHCEEHLVYYKRPANIILMDALPRSSSGKILPDQLP